ncbi:MAG TPA: hypothetical protein VGO07_04335 [Candidatus Saccharimonadales bacterium]|jgi:hypothetical protein|nr:hypothetical protein [Candidatus Saccharimonadales bacterium]
MTRISTNNQLFVKTFRQTVAVFVGILLLLISLTWLQGPRIRSAIIDAGRVTVLPNQRLSLHANESIGAPATKQVTVTPAVRFVASSGGNTVVLQFNEPLHFATRYRVAIHAGKHVIDYSFTTKPAVVYYAVNTGENSEIHARTLPAGKDKVVFAGGAVDDFAVLGNNLVLNLKYKNDTNLLTMFDMVTEQPAQIALPASGSIEHLRIAPDRQSFGFLFTASEALSPVNRNLMLYRLSGNQLTSVTGFDNKPVETLDWRYAADSNTILDQQMDSNVLLLSPKHPPVPLGQFSSIFGLSYDSTNIVLGQLMTGIVSMNIQTSRRTMLPQPSRTGEYLVVADPLRTRKGYLLHTQTIDDRGSSQQLIVERNGKQQKIYSINNLDAYITHVDMSVNDQMAAVSKNDTPDNTPNTDVIDTYTGKKVVTLPGNIVRWQQ